jgi:TRAP-type C4-dicarboxylate transport system permease small subunit
MATQKKTDPKILLCSILFLGGMIIGGWGWDKNESTIAKRTRGAVPMMIVGCSMIAAGSIGFFAFGNRKGQR